MKTLLDFNLTAKKNPLPCVVETSDHKMYCIYWPVMKHLKKGCAFFTNKIVMHIIAKHQLTGVIETSGQMVYS